MLSHLVLLLLFSSGSIFGAAVLKKRYEEVLPIYLLSVIMILFIFGLAGVLPYGVLAIFVLSLLLIIIALARTIRQGSIRPFVSNLFTPGAFLFLAVWVIFTLLNHGRMNSTYDEFSHWADVVKVMVSLDDFATSSASHSMFPNYPPGTALLQYLVQKVYVLLEPGSPFCEWRLYFTRQIFFVALIIPFFSCFSWRQISLASITMACILLLPLSLFNDYHSNFYSSLYIDSFLGILAGVGFAMVFFWKRKDVLYHAYMPLLLSMLVLTKQAGLIYAVFLALFYVVDSVGKEMPHRVRRLGLQASAALLGVLLPQLLWNYEVSSNQVNSIFQPTLGFSRLLDFTVYQRQPYLIDVWNRYFEKLRTGGVAVGATGWSIPYYALLLLLLGIFVLLLVVLQKQNRHQISLLISALGILLLCAVYLVGLAVIYMVQFSQEEALALASFDRYVRIVYMMLLMMCALGSIQAIAALEGRRFLAIAVAAVAVCVFTPWNNVRDFVSRRSVKAGIAWRLPLDVLCDEVKAVARDESARVYIIAQDTTGNEYMAMRYVFRPYIVNPWGSWSLCLPDGESGEGPQRFINPQELAVDIVANYEYVLLYKVNGRFVENFSSLFSNPAQIANGTLFSVNKVSRLLDSL